MDISGQKTNKKLVKLCILWKQKQEEILINNYGYDIYNILSTEIITPNTHTKYSVLKKAIDYIAFLEKVLDKSLKLGLNK